MHPAPSQDDDELRELVPVDAAVRMRVDAARREREAAVEVVGAPEALHAARSVGYTLRVMLGSVEWHGLSSCAARSRSYTPGSSMAQKC
jgi:hypothetical protein